MQSSQNTMAFKSRWRLSWTQTDIFRTMHVTAFGQHRLEATAPWGLIQEKRTEEKATLPANKFTHGSGALRHAVAR